MLKIEKRHRLEETEEWFGVYQLKRGGLRKQIPHNLIPIWWQEKDHGSLLDGSGGGGPGGRWAKFYWALGLNNLKLKAMVSHSVLLPGKSHGRRNLVACSPWGYEESDTTEWLHFEFSLSCIGEGKATHSSILAWRFPGMGEPGWAAIYGIAQSQTEWLSSSSSSSVNSTRPFGQNGDCQWICFYQADESGPGLKENPEIPFR